MRIDFSQSFRSQCVERLDEFDWVAIDDPALCPASVVIGMVRGGETGEVGFYLTRRSSRLSRHQGQYALPGGRLDEGEDASTAALRELEEELGVKAKPTDIIGRLDDFPTRSGFCVTPLVLWLDSGIEPAPDPDEVETVFNAPLEDLTQPQVPRLHRIPESDQPVLSIPFASLGDEVFSPTAAILYQFREVVLYGRSTRVAHYEQPLFAWK